MSARERRRGGRSLRFVEVQVSVAAVSKLDLRAYALARSWGVTLDFLRRVGRGGRTSALSSISFAPL